MKLYLLSRNQEDVGYDEYDAKLVRAFDEDDARAIANKYAGGEGRLWDIDSEVICEEVTQDGPRREIIGSFNAG